MNTNIAASLIAIRETLVGLSNQVEELIAGANRAEVQTATQKAIAIAMEMLNDPRFKMRTAVAIIEEVEAKTDVAFDDAEDFIDWMMEEANVELDVKHRTRDGATLVSILK